LKRSSLAGGFTTCCWVFRFPLSRLCRAKGLVSLERQRLGHTERVHAFLNIERPRVSPVLPLNCCCGRSCRLRTYARCLGAGRTRSLHSPL